MATMSRHPPTLTVSTGGIPSTPMDSVRHRPQGARRRGLNPGGYFISNPDNSDDDDPPRTSSPAPHSPPHTSPRRSSSSPRSIPAAISIPPQHGVHSYHGASPASIGRKGMPVPASSGSGSNGTPGVGVAVPGVNGLTNNTALSTSPNAAHRVFPLPLPALPLAPPPSTPLPTPIPYPSHSAPLPDQPRPTPPQPPPQPDRHRRAYTTPTSETPRAVNDIPRSNTGNYHPPSPTRALPPLPGTIPPSKTGALPPSGPSPPSSSAPVGTSPRVNMHMSSPGLALQQSSSPASTPGLGVDHRVSSPDAPLSSTSEGPSRRLRSGSVPNKVWLQVTTDNERFATVEITGLESGEAIRERMFSRLRFRDEVYPTLSIYRTNIGEAHDPTELWPQALWQLCHTEADSRGSLKFLVVQTSAPTSISSVVPPPSTNQASFRTRPDISPIMTDVAPPYTPRPEASMGGGVSEPMGRGRSAQHGIEHPPHDNDPHVGGVGRWSQSSTSGSEMLGLARGSSSYLTQSSMLATPPQEEATMRTDSIAGPSSTAAEVALAKMDAASAAEIRRIQLEEAEFAKRQAELLRRDEVIALKAQEDEHKLWQQGQQVMEAHRNAMVRSDEAHSRGLMAQEQQHADEVARLSAGEAAWVAIQNEMSEMSGMGEQGGRELADPGRAEQFVHDRQQRRDHFQNHVGDLRSWLPADPGGSSTPVGGRRPSEPPMSGRVAMLPSRSSTMPVTQLPPGAEPYLSSQPPTYDHVSPAPFGEASLTPSSRIQSSVRIRASPAPTPYPPPAFGSVDDDRRQLHGARSTDNLRHGPQQSVLSRYGTGTRGPITPVAERSPTAYWGVEGRHHDPTLATVRFPSPQPWPEGASPPRTGIHSPDSRPGPSVRDAGRPTTYYDRQGPPAGNGYLPVVPAFNRTRSGSDSYMFNVPSSQLPYVQDLPVWPGPSRRGTEDSNTTSVATITPSDATFRPGDRDDDGTIRPQDWRHRLEHLIGDGGVMTDAHGVLGMADGDGEATLFISTPPSQGATLRRGGAVRDPPRPLSASDSDSADEDLWKVRPETEQLYDNLHKFFPKVDLDKPIVDEAPVTSAPSTPNSDSPRRTTFDGVRPPPQHPGRQTVAAQVAAAAAEEPVKTHTPRSVFSAGVKVVQAAFNKPENRRSIRNVADLKKRSLQKQNLEQISQAEVLTAVPEGKKVKRSSSMWGHKVVEVTPSRMAMDLPPSIPESPSADGQPPTLSWVKGELIGKGSYGRVYIALKITTGDMMAVKQVELPATEQDRNDSRHTTVVDALRSEIELLKDLEHPNIVAYLGCESSVEYLTIFLEYVSGGSIASLYRTRGLGRFEEQLVKFFTKQILQGLSYLHEQNIWHRDLKGDNILVNANGVCKISDFGISKKTAEDAYASNSNATSMQGTAFWMAPEAIHAPAYSGKIDIWSLGCVVVEMWTGARPWRELEVWTMMLQVFNEKKAPPLPADLHLSDDAMSFMYTYCMAPDPKDRPTARELLSHTFITQTDPRWTFDGCKIGKAIAKRPPKTVRSASGGAVSG